LLIIFDLDDTLIDTSGSITPIRMEAALNRWILEGAPIQDEKEALDILLRLDKRASSAKQALEEFLELHDMPLSFLPSALEEVYDNPSLHMPIFPQEGAINLLVDLFPFHTLAIVTAGHLAIQMEKLKKAGIDSSYFSKIAVCGEGDKKRHYKAIAEDLKISPSNGIVCGDRILQDLSPAKELGFTTVHLLKGRGNTSHGRMKDVDLSIPHLRDLKTILV